MASLNLAEMKSMIEKPRMLETLHVLTVISTRNYQKKFPNSRDLKTFPNINRSDLQIYHRLFPRFFINWNTCIGFQRHTATQWGHYVRTKRISGNLEFVF